MSQATLGYKTFLQRDDGTGNFNTIAEVIKIAGPTAKVDMKDATNMSSPLQTKEIIAGLEDPGQISFEINWVPSDPQQNGLLVDKTAKTLRNWKILFPPTFSKTSWSFAGYVSGFNTTFPVDDRITAAVTIDISGPMTLA